MRSWNRTINVSVVALAMGLAAAFGYHALEANRRPLGPTGPTTIATFDLEHTFNTIEQKKQADAALTKMAADFQTQADEATRKLQQMENELDDHVPGSARHRELLEKLSLAAHEYKAQNEYFTAKLDIEHARVIKNIYQVIRETAAQLARENGYAVVFVDDSIAEIPPGSREDINRQISARRMVYTSDEVDVTEALIARLNAAHQAAAQPGAQAANP